MDNQYTPIIGKDVIESLTTAMYEDSKFIYREYIQNSADQIDKAIKECLIEKDKGVIFITIDADKREIVIEDNATGICVDQVQPILKNIAQSPKQRGIDKGFRGIGRLGGLAYCEKLIFETSFFNENKKSILEWDALKLKEIINNRKNREEAVSVLQEVTSFSTKEENLESHYFKVILKNVTDDLLLNKKEIEKYLSMIAPIPFNSHFIFKTKILDELKKENIILDEYKIYLNTEQLFKAYSTSIYRGDINNKIKDDEIIDINFFKEFRSDKQLLYWGWYSITEKNQSINQINYARGFRLRKYNIQIGDEYTLMKLQRDKRFHFYFFGEVYAIHPELIPNARRDYFIESSITTEFENKLKQFFHSNIYNLCYVASDLNANLKRINNLKTFEEEYNKKQENGFVNKEEKNELIEKFKKIKKDVISSKRKIENIQNKINSQNELKPLEKILNKVVNENNTVIKEDLFLVENNIDKLKYRTENLSKLNREERKFLGKIFSIIRNVLNPDIAENLIKKIEEEFK